MPCTINGQMKDYYFTSVRLHGFYINGLYILFAKQVTLTYFMIDTKVT